MGLSTYFTCMYNLVTTGVKIEIKVIPQYCIAYPYYARFPRYKRAQMGAYTYSMKEIVLKQSSIEKNARFR